MMNLKLAKYLRIPDKTLSKDAVSRMKAICRKPV